MKGFAEERRLQPVGDMAGHFALDLDRPFAVGVVEGHGPLDRLRIRGFAAHHLDQRDEMGRIEGMAHDEARTVSEAFLQRADQEARRARPDHRVRRQYGIDTTVERALERLVLRRVLLNEDRAFDRVLRLVHHAHSCRVGARAEAEPLHRGPGRVDEGAEAPGGVGCRVPRRDREAAGQEIGRPAGTDRAGAEQRDIADRRRCGPCHESLLRLPTGRSWGGSVDFAAWPRRPALYIPRAPGNRGTGAGAACCRRRTSWWTRW